MFNVYDIAVWNSSTWMMETSNNQNAAAHLSNVSDFGFSSWNDFSGEAFMYRYGYSQPFAHFMVKKSPIEESHRQTLSYFGDGQVYDMQHGRRLLPEKGQKYAAKLGIFTPDGRYVPGSTDDGEGLIDTKTQKHIPLRHALGGLKYDGNGRFVGCELRRIVSLTLVPTAHLDIPPEMLELWAQVAVRGELGPNGEFVKWDEQTWEKNRQQLSAMPAPDPNFPFPGYVATDKLHWQRAEFNEAKTEGEKLRIARELLRRSEAAGDRNESVRWRDEVDRRTIPIAPPPREVKP